jgi:hypothetical protein
MKEDQMITASKVRRLLFYSKSRGQLRWRESLSPRTPVGSVAGSINADGLCVVQIAGRKYLGHRIAVLHTTGRWPENKITHRNGDRADVRWRNLRFA